MPPTKWYVNLNANYGRTTKSHAGTDIELVATRNTGHGIKSQGRREVDWVLVDAGPHASDLDYVVTQADLDHARTTERNNGKFYNTLRIPALGGRTYTVTASKHNRANNVTFNKQYETWRRIYYSVHTMTPQCRRLFESVEQEIKDIFAGVYIELKRRHMKSCIVNEDVTVSDTHDPTLPHTYRGPALDRDPHHLRAVVVRDLACDGGFAVHWTMDAQTTADPNKLIGVESDGQNHHLIIYKNSIATIDMHQPTANLCVHVHSASVAVPNACITRNSDHQLTVDFTADQTTTPISNALSNARQASLTATLTGIRCDAGFHAGNDHSIQADISRATTQPNAVTVGSASVWISDDGTTATIHDPNIILAANPGAADNLTITLNNGTVVNLQVGDITRQDDHTLQIDLTSDQQVTAALGHDETVQLEVQRHGVLGHGAITSTADYDFDFREFGWSARATRQRVNLEVDASGHTMQILVPWLWLAANNALRMNVETLGAGVNVPAHAVRAATPQRLEIDLSADQSLQPAAAAMLGGGKITIDGKLNGLHALGGYSPTSNREFIALTARKIRDNETEADTARRIKLVFCHELGHALGLGWNRVRNRTSNQWEDNDLHYRSAYGGQGSHCSHNAHLQPSGADHGRESTSSGEVYVHAGGGKLCIMYHAIDLANMGDDFCDRCKQHLRRTAVTLG